MRATPADDRVVRLSTLGLVVLGMMALWAAVFSVLGWWPR